MGEGKKSGRTPEQQAARDARKAAKAAAAAETSASATTTTAVDTASGASAEPEAEAEAGLSKKSKYNEETYEIDINAPTPLSKAELRAAKRKAKRGEEVDETEKPKKRKKLPEYDPAEADPEAQAQAKRAGAGKEERPPKPKKQNSVWIGNLAFKTTDEQLKAWIEKGVVEMGGETGGVTRVNLPKTPGRGGYSQSKGYAYVDFETPELQALAVGLSERLLDGRKLLIKLGNDHSASETARTPKPAAVKGFAGKQPNPESATLFVGNLPFDATEEGLRDLVESNAPKRAKKVVDGADEGDDEDKEDKEEEEGGEEVADEDKEEQAYRGGRRSGLRKVRLGAFEDTGKCKGFAFLDFLETKHATAALNTRGNHFYGARKLTLQYASEAAAKRSGGKKNHAAFAEEKPVRKPREGREGREGRPARKWGNKDAGEDGGDGHEHETKAAGAFDQAALARQVLGAGAGGADGGYEGGEDRPRKNDKRGKKWETTGRPRPGAALAMAKRENVAIVAPQGQKISFD